MHVDGFRFDLATILGREHGHFDRGAAFFDVLQQDPALRAAKLIAEPWDATAEGFALGAFPRGFREWNSHFRDDGRRFWNGYEKRLGPLGYRLSGSSDVFGSRGPTDSIDFVTCHDGFTLRDLVSYEERHNEKNGEGNADGSTENFAANFGVEGPTDEPAVIEARARQIRNLLATLLLTPGVPMLLSGDEMGRTQRGNNNAYCLDDATSWLPWVLDATGRDLLAFTRGLVALRRELVALRPTAHFQGEAAPDVRPDLRWLRPDGEPMHGHDWDVPDERGIAMLIGEGPARSAATTLALLLNGGAWPLDFVLPPLASGSVLVDTRESVVPLGKALAGGVRVYHLEPRSLALLRLQELP
jgi:glycogen operon protein